MTCHRPSWSGGTDQAGPALTGQEHYRHDKGKTGPAHTSWPGLSEPACLVCGGDAMPLPYKQEEESHGNRST
jgi:hypothetical protein